MVGSSPKIVSKLVFDSKRCNDPVKVMAPSEEAMGRTRSIFEVDEEVSAVGGKDWGVKKGLYYVIDRIGVECDFVIVLRALITNLRNWSRSTPERISSDKLPRVNTRSKTG